MIPMGKLTGVRNERREFFQQAEIMSRFVEIVAGKKAKRSIMDRAMEIAANRDSSEFAETVCACLPVELPFSVQLSMLAPVKQQLLLNDKELKDSPLFRQLMLFLATASNQGNSGLLLFRVAFYGLYVAHNIDMARGNNLRIVVPTSVVGMTSLQIMPLKTWEIDYRSASLLHNKRSVA